LREWKRKKSKPEIDPHLDLTLVNRVEAGARENRASRVVINTAYMAYDKAG